MCEFCNNNPFSKDDKRNVDWNDPDFTGFFSSEAINAAIQKVKCCQQKRALSLDDAAANDDDDGT